MTFHSITPIHFAVRAAMNEVLSQKVPKYLFLCIYKIIGHIF